MCRYPSITSAEKIPGTRSYTRRGTAVFTVESMVSIPAALTAPDNRFARFTADNHSAPIWIASLLSLIFAFCILAVRLGFLKWNVHGLDDVVLTLAHFVGLGMWGALFSSLNNGLGKSLEPLSVTEISDMQKSYFASFIMFVIALALSKCSALMFIRTVFSRNSKISFGSVLTACAVVLWVMGSSLAVSFSCSSSQIIPSPENDHCVRLVPWLKFIAAGDILTEIVIVVLPVMGVCNLQMPIGRKLLVVVAFACRIPNILISAMHLITHSDFHGQNRQAIDIGRAVVWQNILLSYNLMSATLPTLKGFVKKFKTGGVGYATDMSTSGGRRKDNNRHELQVLANPSSEGSERPKATFSGNVWYREGSVASSESRQIMVTKTCDISYS